MKGYSKVGLQLEMAVRNCLFNQLPTVTTYLRQLKEAVKDYRLLDILYILRHAEDSMHKEYLEALKGINRKQLLLRSLGSGELRKSEIINLLAETLSLMASSQQEKDHIKDIYIRLIKYQHSENQNKEQAPFVQLEQLILILSDFCRETIDTAEIKVMAPNVDTILQALSRVNLKDYIEIFSNNSIHSNLDMSLKLLHNNIAIDLPSIFCKLSLGLYENYVVRLFSKGKGQDLLLVNNFFEHFMEKARDLPSTDYSLLHKAHHFLSYLASSHFSESSFEKHIKQLSTLMASRRSEPTLITQGALGRNLGSSMASLLSRVISNSNITSTLQERHWLIHRITNPEEYSGAEIQHLTRFLDTNPPFGDIVLIIDNTDFSDHRSRQILSKYLLQMNEGGKNERINNFSKLSATVIINSQLNSNIITWLLEMAFVHMEQVIQDKEIGVAVVIDLINVGNALKKCVERMFYFCGECYRSGLHPICIYCNRMSHRVDKQEITNSHLIRLQQMSSFMTNQKSKRRQRCKQDLDLALCLWY